MLNVEPDQHGEESTVVITVGKYGSAFERAGVLGWGNYDSFGMQNCHLWKALESQDRLDFMSKPRIVI